MTLDDFLSGKIVIEPSVFDRHFALPDTPLVAFQFNDLEILRLIASAFQFAHPREDFTLDTGEKRLYASRHGSTDTPRLLLDVIRDFESDKKFPKDGIKVFGLNEMPE